MADTMDPAVRSRVMARIRGRNTKPEMYVRRTAWGQGFRYRLHVRRLPGAPDLVFAQYRVVLLVHGCFWHQHGCSKSRRPSSNRDYWGPKLDRNMDRDARNQARLRELGWKVMVIWECRLQEDTHKALCFLRGLRANRQTEEWRPQDTAKEEVRRTAKAEVSSSDRRDAGGIGAGVLSRVAKDGDKHSEGLPLCGLHAGGQLPGDVIPGQSM